MQKNDLANTGIKSLAGFIKGFFSNLNQGQELASPRPEGGFQSKYGDQVTNKPMMTMPDQDEWQPIKEEEIVKVSRTPQEKKEPMFDSSKTQMKQQAASNIASDMEVGRSKVVADTKRLYPKRYEAAKNLVQSRTDDPLLQSLILDIAAAENSLKGTDDKNLEGSTSSSFLQFNDPTWSDYERWIGKKLDKSDPKNQVDAALWLLTQKDIKGVTKLERWNASKNKWGSNYSPEEIQQFYMNANNNS